MTRMRSKIGGSYIGATVNSNIVSIGVYGFWQLCDISQSMLTAVLSFLSVCHSEFLITAITAMTSKILETQDVHQFLA